MPERQAPCWASRLQPSRGLPGPVHHTHDGRAFPPAGSVASTCRPFLQFPNLAAQGRRAGKGAITAATAAPLPTSPTAKPPNPTPPLQEGTLACLSSTYLSRLSSYRCQGSFLLASSTWGQGRRWVGSGESQTELEKDQENSKSRGGPGQLLVGQVHLGPEKFQGELYRSLRKSSEISNGIPGANAKNSIREFQEFQGKRCREFHGEFHRKSQGAWARAGAGQEAGSTDTAKGELAGRRLAGCRYSRGQVGRQAGRGRGARVAACAVLAPTRRVKPRASTAASEAVSVSQVPLRQDRL